MVSHQKIGMTLRQAFDIRPGAVVSIVGGGGKTTLMFRLAREIESAGEKVVTTTTTRIFEPSESETYLIVEADEGVLLNLLPAALEYHRHVTLGASRLPEGKLKGICSTTVDRMAAMRIVPYIINEADGSARKPLKAPNATEPVIPQSTTLVIAVVGIDALGQSLNEENVFRPEIVSLLTGLALGGEVTEDTIAVLLTHREGICKGTPPHARIVPVINKTDLLPDLSAAESLAKKIMDKGHPQIKRVVLGQFERGEPVAGVIGE